MAVAKARGARVDRGRAGRGLQLRAGMASAEGEWRLALHADTVLAPGWSDAVDDFMAAPRSADIAGYGRLQFDEDSAGARRLAAIANWRARRLGLPYGDQTLLLHRDLYESCGGYPDWPLMEDVALVRAIGRRRLRALPITAQTSAERYRRGGWWSRPMRNLGCLSLYYLGVAPARIARLYGS